MGFGGLKCIPKWSVDQESYLYLAENFNLIRNYIRTDVDDITVNAAIIGLALDLPSHGLEFPDLDKKIPHHDAICSRWGGSTNVFFRPTSTAKISPNKHLPTILDVENVMAYYWSFHILDSIKDAIADFQHNGVKHISGCMYALLILYFQRIRHGPLERCTIEPPWIRDWSAEVLKLKDDMEEGEDDPLDKKSGTKKKESHKKKRKKGEDDVTFDKTEEIHVENEEIIDDGQNKDEIVPRIQTWTELAEELKGKWKEIEEIIDNDPNFNIYGELNSSESPGRPSFSLGFSQDSKSPTPPRNPTEEILNIPPVSHILPIENPIAMMLSKGLSEAETKKIYSWVIKSSRQESVRREIIASFKGKFEFSLSRDDMMCLKPRE
ncbi:hypothetical protein PIB30_086777 [Stylosanthes scabra]|uniref:Aminotransferase-like plant mobile domain-containing protein n=1 Tax=Stylosanthes scabra TaxID=79078 RepID=A0ABU6VRY8_9FABA|nr:hypothetical protein [Stylosanthes scabra]